jgi:putative ABC transport system permease protein
VRAALGGSRVRLIRQLLVESLLLAGLAAAAGILLAQIGIDLLLALGPQNLPRLDHVAIDPTVIGFTAIAAIVSAVVFGLVPALRASRPDVMDLLRRAGCSSNLASGRSFRTAVVVLEVALAFVLLVGSELMLRSFVALQRAQPGYDPHGVLTFLIANLPVPEDAARQAFQRDLRAKLAALPGVTSGTPLPLDPRPSLARYGPEEVLTDASKFGQATVHFVQPGYFDVMRTRVAEGRGLTDDDNRPGMRNVVIDRVLAARVFPGRSAVGGTILLRITTPEPERFTVVGVVEHQRHESLAHDGRAQSQTRFALVLIGIFAGIALVLAAVGLYSVLSTTVRQRQAEIGVRMAFGAEHGRIFLMMVWQGLKLSAAGLAGGTLAALVLTGIIRSPLVGVEPTDPLAFAAMGGAFLVIATVACGVPALRASRLDPMVALRDE